jgi:accessory gene regulator B
MISKLAHRTAIELKRRNPKNPNSIAKLHFALHIVYNVVFTLLTSLVIALILGHFLSTLSVLASSYVLRRYSGGYHMSNSWECITLTVILSNVVPYVSLNLWTIITLNIISLILILVYAPSRIEEDTNIPKEKYGKLKLISFSIVSISMFLLSSLIAVTFFLQSVSLIRLRKRSE